MQTAPEMVRGITKRQRSKFGPNFRHCTMSLDKSSQIECRRDKDSRRQPQDRWARQYSRPWRIWNGRNRPRIHSVSIICSEGEIPTKLRNATTKMPLFVPESGIFETKPNYPSRIVTPKNSKANFGKNQSQQWWPKCDASGANQPIPHHHKSRLYGILDEYKTAEYRIALKA